MNIEAQVKRRWEAEFGLGSGPIPVRPYIDATIFDLEVEKVWKKVWLYVGRVEEIPEVGDYKVKRISFANTSAILIRGRDQQVRAFHNICSHRGNTVVTETGVETWGSSKAAVLSCRFHGWIYDAEGQLRSVPEEAKFSSCFDKAENGLAPIACDVWNGFIFVCLDRQPQESLAEYLGAYAEHIGDFPYEALTHSYSYEAVIDCNWKVAVDSFCEAYHVHTIHAGSFPNVFSSDLYNVKFFNDHRTAGVMFYNPPPATGVAKVAQERARGSLVHHANGSMLPKRVNPDRREDFSFELSVCFPHALISLAEGIWFTHEFWPLNVDQTYWIGKYYVEKPRTNSERWALQHAVTIQRNAWLEDTATMEDTQRALKSGAKEFLNIQDDEILIRHQYNVMQRHLSGKV